MSLITWIIHSSVIGLLLVGAGASLDAALSRFRLPTRWVWLATASLTAALSLAPFAFPSRAPMTASSTAPPAGVQFGGGDVLADGGGLSLALERLGRPMEAATEATAAAAALVASLLPEGMTFHSEPLLPSGTATAILLMVVLVSSWRLHRSRMTWPASSTLGRRVRIANRFGPAVIGITQPEIVLPRWVLSLPSADLELVLQHEEEHVRSRDTLLLALGLLPLLLLPWNAAVWWQLRRLGAAIELDCDRRVLRRGASVDRYAQLLMRVGTGYRQGPAPISALSGSSSPLTRRLAAMKNSSSVARRSPALLTGAISLILLLVACGLDAPVEPETAPERLSESSSESVPVDVSEPLPTGAALGDTGRETVTVNGNTLVADSIAIVPPQVGASDRADQDDGDRVLVRNPTAESANRFRPLVVVDGVIIGDPEFDMESLDIESIEIVRGPAAAERYGPRAANGVILVRTRAAAQP